MNNGNLCFIFLERKKKSENKKKNMNLVFLSCSATRSSNSYPTNELHNDQSTDACVIQATSLIYRYKPEEKG